MNLFDVHFKELPNEVKENLKDRLIDYAFQNMTVKMLDEIKNKSLKIYQCRVCGGEGKIYDTYQMGVDINNNCYTNDDDYSFECKACGGTGWNELVKGEKK